MGEKASIMQQLGDSIRLMQWLQDQIGSLTVLSTEFSRCLRQGNKVLFVGNGGSAADAQHLAGELAGRFHRDREPLPAVALTANIATLTAIANDYGYEQIFARQVRAMARPGDIVICMSTSGSSPNVLLAVEEAKRCGATTIAFTGEGGALGAMADYALAVPSRETPRIQETYMVAAHLICSLVEEELYGNEPA